ncbi:MULTISPECIES: acetylxylan esterase [unclassified Microbacterium]|uniref:acetylxylan esterase n=1 Tax=unclassified Microbacterium TaxID=2609290 RepID=UPI00214C78E3|nr:MULTISPECIES: acetylxylan esterase [unclassified Microbacterium]MCR2785112.1 acetylxylan esterase [Microbacterium sp. zg.B96]WIM16646.1 acetylxylan esterase [Microbacterium sp. zg-B96]
MPRFDLTPDELAAYRPDVREPDDFDEFWSRTLTESRAAGGEVVRRQVDTPFAVFDVFDLTFPGFAGEPVRAWLTLPRGVPGPLPAVVEFNGYGGGRGLPGERSDWAAAGYAHLFMDTRGQGSTWGSGGDTPDPHGAGPSASGFLTRGIDDPDTYYYRRVYTDAVRAIDAVRTLPEVDPARVAVAGGSQGGGITLAAAGLAEGLVAAMPDVPFLCHFERAVGLTDRDPYQEVVRYLSVHRGADDRVFDTLSYFDGVNFAKRATAPALFSVALMDPVCPPSTVYAAFNHYAGDRRIEVYTHNQHEGGQAHQWFAQAAFLATQPVSQTSVV